MTDDELLAILVDQKAPADSRRCATAELYTRYLTPALNAARYALQGTSVDPEDIVQEVFITGLTAIVQGALARPGVPFRAYLLVCVRNAAINALRRLRSETSLSEALASETPSPLDLLILQEDDFHEVRAEDLLHHLPKRVAGILRTFYLEKTPITRIAARRNLSVRAVYQQLALGRKLLKQQLAIRMVLQPTDPMPPLGRRITRDAFGTWPGLGPLALLPG